MEDGRAGTAGVPAPCTRRRQQAVTVTEGPAKAGLQRPVAGRLRAGPREGGRAQLCGHQGRKVGETKEEVTLCCSAADTLNTGQAHGMSGYVYYDKQSFGEKPRLYLTFHLLNYGIFLG